MSTTRLKGVIHHLRKVALRTRAATADGELLDQFLKQHCDASFEILVHRHGPMVWGVCRRFLHNHHDAEDAFQATFLVFLRKAASIFPREMVGNWLYGVAYQTALNARTMARKRKDRHTELLDSADRMPPQSPETREEQRLLDQELCRLPANYRAVIVLCELEGQTRKEAARHLKVPEGTIAGWLARAKSMLAKRLARHGCGVTAGAVTVMLAQNSAFAAVPSLLTDATIKAASLLAAGQNAAGVVLPNAVALSEGVMKAMFATKCKALATALVAPLVCTCLIVGVAQTSSPVSQAPGSHVSGTQDQLVAQVPAAPSVPQEGARPIAPPKPSPPLLLAKDNAAKKMQSCASCHGGKEQNFFPDINQLMPPGGLDPKEETQLRKHVAEARDLVAKAMWKHGMQQHGVLPLQNPQGTPPPKPPLPLPSPLPRTPAATPPLLDPFAGQNPFAGKKPGSDPNLIPDAEKLIPPGVLDPEQEKQLKKQLEDIRNIVKNAMLKHTQKQKSVLPPPVPTLSGGPPSAYGLVGPVAGMSGNPYGVPFGFANRLGGQVQQPGETLTQQLSLPRDQGLVVHNILLDSAAARAGMKNHDILLELGGKKVPHNLVEFSRILNEFKTGEPIDAVVVRKGKHETLKGLMLPEAVQHPNSFGSYYFDWQANPPQAMPLLKK